MNIYQMKALLRTKGYKGPFRDIYKKLPTSIGVFKKYSMRSNEGYFVDYCHISDSGVKSMFNPNTDKLYYKQREKDNRNIAAMFMWLYLKDSNYGGL